jgi:hypothetical protein
MIPYSEAPSAEPPSYAPWSETPSFGDTSMIPLLTGEPSGEPPSGLPLTEVPSLVPWGEIAVRGVLRFSFFEEAPHRAPTPEEVSLVMQQLQQFYTEVLEAAFPGVFFGVEPVTHSRRHLQEGEALDFDLYFDLELFFTADGSEPSEAEIYEALIAADYIGTFYQSPRCNILH